MNGTGRSEEEYVVLSGEIGETDYGLDSVDGGELSELVRDMVEVVVERGQGLRVDFVRAVSNLVDSVIRSLNDPRRPRFFFCRCPDVPAP